MAFVWLHKHQEKKKKAPEIIWKCANAERSFIALNINWNHLKLLAMYFLTWDGQFEGFIFREMFQKSENMLEKF